MKGAKSNFFPSGSTCLLEMNVARILNIDGVWSLRACTLVSAAWRSRFGWVVFSLVG